MDVKGLIFVFVFLVLVGSVSATQYFHYDAEDESCDSDLPNPLFVPYDSVTDTGTVKCDEVPPQGNKYMSFHYQEGISSQGILNYLDINPPLTNIDGKTLYLAFWFKIDRINGENVFHCDQGTSDQSAHKFIELYKGGVCEGWYPVALNRMIINLGTTYTALPCPYFTLNIGSAIAKYWNPDRTNPGNDELFQNFDCDFTSDNCNLGPGSYRFTYDTWHSLVWELKMKPDQTGHMRLWANGKELYRMYNMRTLCPTMQSGYDEINSIKLLGTIAQPDYDAPSHYNKFDDIIYTDNWQDIVDGGYLTTATCPDGTCDIGETCLLDNCCNGVTISGDCCSTNDCAAEEVCNNNVCEPGYHPADTTPPYNEIDNQEIADYIIEWRFQPYGSITLEEIMGAVSIWRVGSY